LAFEIVAEGAVQTLEGSVSFNLLSEVATKCHRSAAVLSEKNSQSAEPSPTGLDCKGYCSDHPFRWLGGGRQSEEGRCTASKWLPMTTNWSNPMRNNSWTLGSAALCGLLLPRGMSIEPLQFFRAYCCRAQPWLAPFFAARFGAPHTAADRGRRSYSGNR
jgi:hypothetical protein